MEDTKQLLQRIVEQNDALIGLGKTTIEALQDVVDKLEGIQTQLVLNDVSTEIGAVEDAIERLSKKLG